uniref:Uncharacterized protein n=1 Tax=Compsopogon caeruleus TaxID=31354 RepID=A0A7S1TG68_9RHOD|mmetsp:Transcript_6022/g.11830  ORF Transcript_6022/g.11830 Transcript_6022/m.11830 type:complete len:445 (+) Transcript_6022:178-1512(+)
MDDAPEITMGDGDRMNATYGSMESGGETIQTVESEQTLIDDAVEALERGAEGSLSQEVMGEPAERVPGEDEDEAGERGRLGEARNGTRWNAEGNEEMEGVDEDTDATGMVDQEELYGGVSVQGNPDEIATPKDDNLTVSEAADTRDQDRFDEDERGDFPQLTGAAFPGGAIQEWDEVDMKDEEAELPPGPNTVSLETTSDGAIQLPSRVTDTLWVNETLLCTSSEDGKIRLWDMIQGGLRLVFSPTPGESIGFIQFLQESVENDLQLLTLSVPSRLVKTWRIHNWEPTLLRCIPLPSTSGETTLTIPVAKFNIPTVGEGSPTTIVEVNAGDSTALSGGLEGGHVADSEQGQFPEDSATPDQSNALNVDRTAVVMSAQAQNRVHAKAQGKAYTDMSVGNERFPAPTSMEFPVAQSGALADDEGESFPREDTSTSSEQHQRSSGIL